MRTENIKNTVCMEGVARQQRGRKTSAEAYCCCLLLLFIEAVVRVMEGNNWCAGYTLSLHPFLLYTRENARANTKYKRKTTTAAQSPT